MSRRGADLFRGVSKLKLEAAIGTTNKRSPTEAEELRTVALVEARERRKMLEAHQRMKNSALWAPRPPIEVVYHGQLFEVVWDGA